MRGLDVTLFLLASLYSSTLSSSEDRVSTASGDCIFMEELIQDAGGRSLLVLQSEARLRQLSKQNLGQHSALFKHFDGADSGARHIGEIRCIADEPSYLEFVVEFPNAAISWYRLVVPIQRGSPDFCSAQLVRVSASS